MRKFSIFIILISFSLSFAYDIEELINGPIRGYTFLPQAKTFSLGLTFSSVTADSFWDTDGNEVTYEDYYEDDVSPKWYRKYISIRPEFAVNQNISFFAAVPLVVEQRYEVNPASWFEDFVDINVYEGQTGIGDIVIGMNILVMRYKDYRIGIGTDLMLNTGSSPYNISENEFSSTGSGHVAQDLFLDFDILAVTNFFVSGALNYRLNYEATYTYQGQSWKEKEGNELDAAGRFTFNITPKVSLGTNAFFSISGHDRIDSNDIEESEASIFFLSPIIGYQILMNSFKINFNADYRFEIAGQNYAKANVLRLNISIFK